MGCRAVGHRRCRRGAPPAGVRLPRRPAPPARVAGDPGRAVELLDEGAAAGRGCGWVDHLRGGPPVPSCGSPSSSPATRWAESGRAGRAHRRRHPALRGRRPRPGRRAPVVRLRRPGARSWRRPGRSAGWPLPVLCRAAVRHRPAPAAHGSWSHADGRHVPVGSTPAPSADQPEVPVLNLSVLLEDSARNDPDRDRGGARATPG